MEIENCSATSSVPPGQANPLPAIIVVHGGGWRNGSKNKFRGLAVEIARRGYVSMAIEYRLGHEALFPAGIQDCNAATDSSRQMLIAMESMPNGLGLSADPQAGIWWG